MMGAQGALPLPRARHQTLLPAACWVQAVLRQKRLRQWLKCPAQRSTQASGSVDLPMARVHESRQTHSSRKQENRMRQRGWAMAGLVMAGLPWAATTSVPCHDGWQHGSDVVPHRSLQRCSMRRRTLDGRAASLNPNSQLVCHVLGCRTLDGQPSLPPANCLEVFC